MNVQFSSQDCKAIQADALVVILEEGDSALSTLGPLVQQALEAEDFKATAGTTISFPSLGQAEARKIIIAGAGKGLADDYRRAGGAAGQIARKEGLKSIVIHSQGLALNNRAGLLLALQQVTTSSIATKRKTKRDP